MKVKIFCTTSFGGVPDLEERINKWIEEKELMIKIIAQSESMGSEKDWGMTISIWYEEKK